MKRKFLLAFLSLTAMVGWADPVEVEVTLSADQTIEGYLTANSIDESTVTKLTLNGKWAYADALFIYQHLANLEELDMSAMEMAASAGSTSVTVANGEGTRNLECVARIVPNALCMGKTKLTTVKLPNVSGKNVTQIGHSSFANCTALTSIDLGGNGNFSAIGACAFYGCSSLTAIDLSFMNTSANNGIGRSAFANCTSLTTVSFPANKANGPKLIDGNAFNGCTALTAIALPNSVQSIGQNAFGVCTKLASVTLPDNANFTAIAPFTFTRCSALQDITLPATITSVGKGAFGASGLRRMTVLSATPPTCDVSDAANPPFLSIRNNIFALTLAGEAVGHEADYRDADGWNYLMAKSLIEDDTQMAGQTNGSANWDFGTLAASSGVRAYVQRTFTDGWNTLVLPFSASAEVVKDALGDGVELATLDRVEGDNLVFHTTDVIEEGVPVIVHGITLASGQKQMLFRGSFTDMANVYVFNGVDISKNNPTVINQVKDGITFTGSMVKKDVTLTNGYFLQNGNLYAAGSDTYKTKGFRAWFQTTSGSRALTFSIDGGETTSIENIDHSTLNIEHSTLNIEHCYDLQGRRISTANGQWSTVNGQLKKGLYIVNGKKVVY